MIEIGKIKEGMTGRQVADLLYDNFLAVISGLGEYATEKWVTDKGYITKASLNGYATEQWVTGRGYITAAAVAEGYATIASVNELAGGVSASLAAVNAALAERVEKTKFAEYFSTEMAKWFVKDDTNRGIKPVNSYGLYSDTYVSAKGVSTGASGGGGGTSYDRLDSWAEYTSAKAGYVLSALLGQDLNSRIASIESGSVLSLTTSGSGNAVTSVSKSGNQLVVTKGATFLTKHQSLAGYATTTALNNGLAGKQDKITDSNKLAYSLISGTPTSLPASDVAAWAKTANKPSYAFSEIANKPTTLGGYGITDAYTATTIDGKLSAYQPLSTAINTGNIGSQSVAYATSAGDSDMLGGVTHSNYMISSRSTTQDVNQSPYTAERPYILRVGSGNANLPNGMQYGNIAHFSAYGADTAFELFGAYAGQTLLYRCGETNEMFSKGWKTIAFTDSNVASATKLQTPRSIWGQSFDGTGDVNGELSIYGGMLVNKHNESGNVAKSAIIINKGGDYFGIGTSTVNVSNLAFGLCSRDFNWISEQLVITNSGNVLIGTTADNGARLQVGGSVVASGSVTAKSSSDYRLKCAFDYNVDYQERLLSLGKVCDFNYTPHAQEREFAFADDKRHTSVIWQDAKKANITGFCSVEEDGYGTINPLSSDLIFTMVGAIQQGIVKTERIEERVVRLEKENEALRKEINDMKGGNYGC